MASKSKRYCSVPQCNTYSGPKTSLHFFPRDEKLRKSWQIKLKIGKKISKYMCVCSKHFLPEDFHPLPPVPDHIESMKFRRKLRNGVIPSQNLPVGSHQSQQKTPRRQRQGSQFNVSNMEFEVKDEMEVVEENFIQEDPASTTNTKAQTFEDKVTQTDITGHFSLCDLLDNAHKMKAFTNVDQDMVSNMKSCCERVATYNGKIIDNLEMKIIIVLVKLKLNISFVCLGILFGISSSSVSRYLYSTLTLLATALKPCIYWPTKEEVLLNMPKCFNNYKKTRVVLDGTEIGVDKCKCLKCRINTYSHYKGRLTVKFLVGIAPSGLITYISRAYGGRISDKGIFNKEKLVEKLDPGDAVMVDKGVLIETECEENLLKLIRPPFLRKEKQFSQADAEKTADIARARVHVERAIERLKSFDILKDQISWYLLPYLNDVMVVVAAVVNLSSPILAEDKFDQYENSTDNVTCMSSASANYSDLEDEALFEEINRNIDVILSNSSLSEFK